MTSCTQHYPIGFLPLSFSFPDDPLHVSPNNSSCSASVNDLLDLMEEDDEEEERTCRDSNEIEDVTTGVFMDNQMNVEQSEIRAIDKFSSKEELSHVNTGGNSAQLSSQPGFDVDNDEGETTRITNTCRGQSTHHMSLTSRQDQDQYHHH